LTNLTNVSRFPVVSNRSRQVGKPVNIYDAKTHLSELVDRAAAGEEIVIAKAGVPTARLVPLRAVHERTPGRWAGTITIAEDFDAPLSGDILAAFEGDAE
jgi:prevent-host-death family protein